MVNERAREPEPEPDQEASLYDQVSQEYNEERERVHYPYVVRDEEQSWEINRHAKIKYYSYPNMSNLVLPDMKVFKQEIPDRNGRHTHQGGVAIFGLEGDAETFADGEHIPWGPGDLLTLPITPGGVEHQHFNRNDPDEPATWLAIRWEPFKRNVGTERIQNETAPWWDGSHDHDHTTDPAHHDYQFRIEEVDYERWADYEPPNETNTLYEDLFVRRNRFRKKLANSRQAGNWAKVTGDEIDWEWNPQGKMKWYVHPAHADRSMYTLLFAVQKIPPGSRSGKIHRQGGIAHYVLAGDGHTIIDGDSYEWSEGDYLGIPVKLEGSTIQHFNDNPERPAKLIIAEPYVHEAVGYDLGCGMKQIEACPEFDGTISGDVFG